MPESLSRRGFRKKDTIISQLLSTNTLNFSLTASTEEEKTNAVNIRLDQFG